MRSEQEMFDLILSVATEDERIRAVYITGSRVNPNAPKDIFQDYDIVYAVADTLPFREDRTWIDRFGERLYMQYPDDGAYYSSDVESNYGWLMQFSDGNRLDLHVCKIGYLPQSLDNDGQYKVLLDKDGCLPKIDKATDESFWVEKPTEEEFLSTCNEFWWCMNNVAKGLWRGEITYVLDMLNDCIRPMLTRQLGFKIGIETDFSVSIGKSAKYMDKWLTPDVWERYLSTYSSAKTDEIWDAVVIMCDLFDEVASQVGDKLDFSYNASEAQNSRKYLERVHHLPKNANEIY